MESDPTDMGNGSDRPILRAAGAVLGDLADLRYDAQWVTYAAGDIGAPHRRERVFIVAYSAQSGWERLPASTGRTGGGERPHGVASGSGDETPVNLLPTPCTGDGQGGREFGRNGTQINLKGIARVLAGDTSGLPDCRELTALLPTPNASDGSGGGQHPDKREGHSRQLIDYVLLCTPSASDGAGGKTSRSGSRISEPLLGGQAREMATGWGKYAPAIARWEALTRRSPAATEPNRNGNQRLAAAFSEWMMGWPAGHVTDPAIGLSRNDQLRIVGNGVCPQQAHAAIRLLLGIAGGVATHTHRDLGDVSALLPTPRNTDGERGPSSESGGIRPSGQPRQKDLNTVTVREFNVGAQKSGAAE